ncbi:MAG: hypothetical protein M1821_006148 [Bathelium mastoideum]|nr:MAG: hypothetical protein M1821_006148 [Bathelium mastoideum]
MERLTSHESQHDILDSPTDPLPSERLRAQVQALLPQSTANAQAEYRVYKRRWFGLIQLVLLNIIVSWDWLTFAAVSSTSAQYFDVSQGAINWLSTGFLFAFVALSPVVVWTLNKGGPKPAIIAASVFTLAGNWVRYAGACAKGAPFGIVVLGQIIIGFAQPFVLSAPTRYSDLWFTDKGRVSATAIASLANPFGGALGQLIGPIWATKPSDIPNMVLYTAILSTVASLPSFFIPRAPPTPPAASSAQPKLPLNESYKALKGNAPFYLILVPFSVYVGFFNAASSLLNQILEPYGFSETDAGIAGALLIIVGLVTSAVVSPLIDRSKKYILSIKILVPIIAAMYIALIWAPETRTVAAPYVICAILGAASFALLPVALEYLVEITFPISPEITSTTCWTAGQLLGAIFIIVMDVLKGTWASEPYESMKPALVFEAVVSAAVVPLPLCLGLWAFKSHGKGRLNVDRTSGPENSLAR